MSALFDRADELAAEQLKNRRLFGWVRPADVYAALGYRAPPDATWDDARGLLAHEWLQINQSRAAARPAERNGGAQGEKTPPPRPLSKAISTTASQGERSDGLIAE